MIIFGTKFWAWGSSLTRQIWRCAKCGFEGQFIEKKGMTFFTLYWIIPVIPLSGIKEMAQCPKCKTRYDNSAPKGGGSGGATYNGGSQNGGPYGNSSMETHNTPPIARP